MARKQVKRRPTKKKQNDIVLRVILLVAWLLVGLYLGIAGWTDIYINELQRKAAEAECNNSSAGYVYRGEIYCTQEDVAVEQRTEQIESLGLQWVSHLPDPLPIVLTAFAFGSIGSIVRIFRMMIGAQEFSSFYTLSLSPALGGLTALMLLGLSSLLPSVFANAKISLNAPLIPFLSLFAGAFSEHIQKWFQAILDKIFGIQKEKTDAT